MNGTVIDIGDYTVSRYEFDASMVSTQEELEDLWNSSNAQEAVVHDGVRTPPDSVHKIKQVSVPLRRIEYVNPRWHSAQKLISRWRCRKCPYGSDAFPIHRLSQPERPLNPPNGHAHPPTKRTLAPPCLLPKLNDDVLVELSNHLQLESLVAFGIAYPRFRELLTSNQILLQQELRCFFLRTPLRKSVLGIGVAFDPDARTFSSDFDWLSQEAFDQYNVRTSIQKRDFQYFLPLAFSRTHFKRVERLIWEQLDVLDTAVRDAETALNVKMGRRPSWRTRPPGRPHETVGVIYKMMNNIVVSLMKTIDVALDPSQDLANLHTSTTTLMHASERAVIAYGHLFHLLLWLCRTHPIILREATDQVYRFIQTPSSRVKNRLPNLGEFIVLVTLVLACPPTGPIALTWGNINGPLLQEAFIRNARWDLKRLPVLEVLEKGCSDFRLSKTFTTSTTSLRLIMFQIAFLDIFVGTYAASPGNLARLDDNYGFPDPAIPERIVQEIKAIYRVNTWPGFFERVHYKRGLTLGKVRFSEMLKDSVRTSAERGYHHPKGVKDLLKLAREREEMEFRWLREQAQRTPATV
jgi:hypothetical protein